MSKHEKMESFFVSRMPTKKINMLPMCNNKKWICKTCDAQKHDVNLFCAIQNWNFTFFWHVVILLLLCNNKNISPWHNNFKSPKQKFGVAEKNFVLTNMQKVVHNARKSTSCRPKESFMPKTNKQTYKNNNNNNKNNNKTGFYWTVKCFLSKNAIISFLNGAPYLGAATSGVLKKKSVLKIYSKFTGEHPCRNVFSIKEHLWGAVSEYYFLCGEINLSVIKHLITTNNTIYSFWRTMFSSVFNILPVKKNDN